MAVAFRSQRLRTVGRWVWRWSPALAVTLGLVLLAPDGAAQKPPATRAASTEHPLATRAAMDVLAKGGSAVDAIAAAALVAGVVNPVSSGIGGGGFALVHRPGDAEPAVLDFREVAPRGLDPVAFEKAEQYEHRGQLVGVPGEVAGLFELVRRFGKLRWADVVAPAEGTARRGFAVGAHLARALTEKSAQTVMRDPSLKALYFPNGRGAATGTVVRNPKLAQTLRRIAAEGPPALYDGVIAAEIAAAVSGAGGTLSVADLRDYRLRDRRPLRGEWAGHTIFTMPPPSGGGLLLLQTAGMLSKEELAKLGWNSGAYVHILGEAFRSTLADRMVHVGDPDLVEVDVARLLDPTRLAERKKHLAYDRTHASALFVSREQGTHHMNVVDQTGMTVALTTTVNRSFGAKLVTPDSGIVLNDQLGDFTLPSDLAAYGLKNGPNTPRPLARPASSMTPTIVVRGDKAVMAIGGSGGMTIGQNVAQLLFARLAFGKSPEELVTAKRFFAPSQGVTLLLEPGVPKALEDDLVFRGEKLTSRALATGVQVITADVDGLKAAADPRKFGAAETR